MEKTIKNPCHECKMATCTGCETICQHNAASWPTLTQIPHGQCVELPPIPEGLEFDPPIRAAKVGDNILSQCGVLRVDSIRELVSSPFCIILRPKRWRAEMEGEYWTVNGGIVERCTEHLMGINDRDWGNGWYWQTREEAESALEKMRKVVEK